MFEFCQSIQYETGKPDFVQHRVGAPHILLHIFRFLTSFVLPYSGEHGPDDNGLHFPYLRIVSISGVDMEYLFQGG